ncbi:hypothetical protein CHR62_07640 [Pusillimonas sp. NJUB218]|nr:hypothetical protein CHR62_07640 [Pusillimonas sp. NJUB218]
MKSEQFPYEHIVTDCTLAVTLTADESAEILRVYDNGFEGLTPAQLYKVYAVLGRLKDQIWP